MDHSMNKEDNNEDNYEKIECINDKGSKQMDFDKIISTTDKDMEASKEEEEMEDTYTFPPGAQGKHKANETGK